MSDALRDAVGEIQPHHQTILVQPEMIDAAVSFFVDQFYWMEWANLSRSEKGHELRFVSSIEVGARGGALIQLTELKVEKPWDTLPAVHPGFKCKNARTTAKAIQDWAWANGYKCTLTRLPRGKVFVNLSTIFAVRIELISSK